MKTLLALLLLIPSLSWGEDYKMWGDDFKMKCYYIEVHYEDSNYVSLITPKSGDFFSFIRKEDVIILDYGYEDQRNEKALIIFENKDILDFQTMSFLPMGYKYFKNSQTLVRSRFDDMTQSIEKLKGSCYGDR